MKFLKKKKKKKELMWYWFFKLHMIIIRLMFTTHIKREYIKKNFFQS